MSYNESAVAGIPANKESLIPALLKQMEGNLAHLSDNLNVLESRMTPICHLAPPKGNSNAAKSEVSDVAMADALTHLLNQVANMIERTDSLLGRLEI